MCHFNRATACQGTKKKHRCGEPCFYPFSSCFLKSFNPFPPVSNARAAVLSIVYARSGIFHVTVFYFNSSSLFPAQFFLQSSLYINKSAYCCHLLWHIDKSCRICTGLPNSYFSISVKISSGFSSRNSGWNAASSSRPLNPQRTPTVVIFAFFPVFMSVFVSPKYRHLTGPRQISPPSTLPDGSGFFGTPSCSPDHRVKISRAEYIFYGLLRLG